LFLELIDLSKHFASRDRGGDVRAVDNINVEIERGQFITLLGPSGCGKTTTLRLIAGFEFPTTGRIVLDGIEINEQPPNQRDMSMVFQSYAIFPHLSVFDNIAYGLKIRKMSRNEIRTQVGRVMDLAELSGLENRAPNQLSGGQQQRVALARALVMEPKVLLFDEPLSNLDAKLRVSMRGEIRRIQQEMGITSIYVTHDQDEAMVLSDKIVVMHNGRIQQIGAAPAIYRRPVNRFVADFIGRANFVPVTVEERTGAGWQIHCLGTTLHIPAGSVESSAGAQAQLLVRPESIRLHRVEENDEAVGINGTVKRMAYLGSQAEYEVNVDGRLISAIHYDPREDELLSVETKVNLEFLTENLYLLPDEQDQDEPGV